MNNLENRSLAHKPQNSDKLTIKSDLFSLEFENQDFTYFGSKYRLILGGNEVHNEYLVHCPSLIRHEQSL